MTAHSSVDPKSRWRAIAVTYVASWACYIIALMLPAFHFVDGDGKAETIPSLLVVLMGWFGCTQGIEYYPWLTNPMFYAGFLLWHRNYARTFLALALMTFALAFSAFFITTIFKDLRTGEQPISRFGAGFYFWQVSMTLNLISGLLLFMFSSHEENASRSKRYAKGAIHAGNNEEI